MGNPISNNNITIIANSDTWIEGRAVQQLETTAKLPQMLRVAGMLDLHPGRGYPVGAAFFSVGRFYPALIGNDIGCGMALWQTDLSAAKAKPTKLARQLGSIDAPLDTGWQARINEILPNHPFQTALGTIGGGNHFAESDGSVAYIRRAAYPFDPKNWGCKSAANRLISASLLHPPIRNTASSGR